MPPDPDPTVERLLKRSLRTHGEPAPDAPCLDAESLAAWIDGGLSSEQLSWTEAHLAQCSRCQAMVAAIARSTPLTPAAEPWWRRHWGLGWLVPLTAATAAVVIWSGTPPPNPPVADRRESAAELSQAPRGAGDPVASPPAPNSGQTPPPPEDARQGFDAETRLRSAADPVRAIGANGKEVRADSARKSADALERLEESAGSRAPSTAPGPTASAAQVAAPRAASSPEASQPAARLDQTLAPSRAGGVATIESPDPRVRWRISVPGVVQRSADGGASWEDLAAGVPTELTTGAAPSTSVCWIVGRQGTIVRTTDGRRWQRIPFPTAADLVAVQAADARSATVTTADGRRFSTADGGNSWIPASLQEF